MVEPHALHLRSLLIYIYIYIMLYWFGLISTKTFSSNYYQTILPGSDSYCTQQLLYWFGLKKITTKNFRKYLICSLSTNDTSYYLCSFFSKN